MTELDMDLFKFLSEDEIDCFIKGEHADPHHVLGAHPINGPEDEKVVIRAFHPDAVDAQVCLDNGRKFPMSNIHDAGLYAAVISGRIYPFHYSIRFKFADGNIWEHFDPYRFLPTIGEMDLHFAGEGTHRELYKKLGAHPCVVDGIHGVSFAVWAPNARRVSLIGDFNRWDGRVYPMRELGSSGIWELLVPGIKPGSLYKYEIKAPDGNLRIKSDPYAFAMELRPATASIVWDLDKYQWEDREWMSARTAREIRNEPMAIYEVHLGSWMRVVEQENRWLTYRELAPKLVGHAKKFGFTHLEFLPLAAYPFDGSWGYQVTGYFAPTRRYGTPDDFKYLVDYCHQNGIGIILDWVPAHFPKDDHSLRRFDGTALYEHGHPNQGEHQDWGTLIFNFGRNEIRNFLISNALFWLKEYHIDGLRVDAVASMLYLDYSRKEGEWIPNRFGGRENLDAVAFIQKLNEEVYKDFPGCFTIAEESTAWGGVTLPTYMGGLGFGFKWNMGWMHDSLLYFGKDPIHRSFHHNKLTFSMLYAYSENFILPLSHDEVVHGKGSLLNKMPGDEWQKFANLRLLLGYMYTHPGKKLLFMGTEIAPYNEWNFETSLDWHLEADPMRQAFQRFLKDLGEFYLKEPALWRMDTHPDGFSWIDCQDYRNGVVSYIRRAQNRCLIIILNLTPVPRMGYRIGVPGEGFYHERLNSDSAYYGGGDMGNLGKVLVEPVPFHSHPRSVSLTLPPLSCLILQPDL